MHLCIFKPKPIISLKFSDVEVKVITVIDTPELQARSAELMFGADAQ